MLIELITNTIFMERRCKKEEFDYYIRRFEMLFIECLGMLNGRL